MAPIPFHRQTPRTRPSLPPWQRRWRPPTSEVYENAIFGGYHLPAWLNHDEEKLFGFDDVAVIIPSVGISIEIHISIYKLILCGNKPL